MRSRVLRGFAGFLLFVAAFIGTAAPAFGVKRPPSYSVIPLGTPGTEEAWSEKFMYPEDINNKGDIIGQRGNGVVLYRDGTIYELGYPRPPLEHGWTSAINDRGEILGLAFGESALSYLLPTLPRPVPVADARILPVSGLVSRDLNDYGTIAGYLYNWQDDTSIPVVYHDRRITELPSLVPGGYAETAAINNRGQIVGTAEFHDDVYRGEGVPGSRAVIWSGNRIRSLGVLPGLFDSRGADINDRGEAVGHCLDLDTCAAFIYRNGVMRPLPSPPGALDTVATRINNAGHVLIAALREGDLYASDWLYADGALHNLAPIVARATGWPVQMLHLFDMNDRGEIIGIAFYPGRDHRLITQGILLVPQHNGKRARVSRSNGHLIAPR